MTPFDGLLGAIDWPFKLESIPGPIGVAVSGGSDSMALLLLMARWAKREGRSIHAVTVDHGLRSEAAAEAATVARACRDLGVLHTTLRWLEQDRSGNLQARARDARYRLMADWAEGQGIGCIVLGHTKDDQAETVLLRLARGSGVDGLAAMKMHRNALGVMWLRPLLTERRDALRDMLRSEGQTWIDDPSNEDLRFDRVKARAALDTLAPMGVTVEGLADTAFRMGLASDALGAMARDMAGAHLRLDRGDALIAVRDLSVAPYETQLRIFAAALCWVATAPYRPRFLALQDAWGAVGLGRPQTLHGALLTGDKTELRITREHNAVKDTRCPTTEVWDGRWQLDGPHGPDLHIAALGGAVKDCPDWRETGLPRTSLLSSPAIWQGETLIAAPLAGYNPDWTARIVTSFASYLLSH